MSRASRADIAAETLSILDQGFYHAPSGERVEIGESLWTAVDKTEEYPFDREVSLEDGAHPRSEGTVIEVTNETTLSAARRLVDAGMNPVALNFASAKNPGGGFLNGAQAQEESLARASGLYACVKDCEMYKYHRRNKSYLYTDYAIYSPDVPVFRDDEDRLLAEPYELSFLTAPAANMSALRQNAPERIHLASPTMARRIERVLTIMHNEGHDSVVAGAWGCGVFGNDPIVVADHFADALNGPLKNRFDCVVFAIYDPRETSENLKAFRNRFAS